jgi:hypothetical protein
MKSRLLAAAMLVSLLGASSAFAGQEPILVTKSKQTGKRPVSQQPIPVLFSSCSATVTCFGDGSGGQITDISGCDWDQLWAIIDFTYGFC